MRTTVKTFLVFVLLMVTCSLGSRAVNFTGMVEKAASTCEMSASSSSLKNASSVMSLIILEATYLQTPSLCGLRMLNLEANLSLKDILLILIVSAELLKQRL